MMGIKESEKGWPSCVALFRAFQIAHSTRTRAVWLKFGLRIGGRPEMEEVEELGQSRCQRDVSWTLF